MGLSSRTIMVILNEYRKAKISSPAYIYFRFDDISAKDKLGIIKEVLERILQLQHD